MAPVGTLKSFKEYDKIKEIYICFVGHVDSGKSTLSGMFQKQLSKDESVERNLTRMNDLASEYNKEGFGLAYLSDSTVQERKRGITINAHFTIVYLEDGRRIIIVDCPGHEGFIRTAIYNAGLTDVAVLNLPSDALEHLDEISHGSFLTHAISVATLGPKHLIMCISKCDSIIAKIGGKPFEEAKKEKSVMEEFTKLCECGYEYMTTEVVKRLGFNPKNVAFCMTAAAKGYGVTPVGEHFEQWDKPSNPDIKPTYKESPYGTKMAVFPDGTQRVAHISDYFGFVEVERPVEDVKLRLLTTDGHRVAGAGAVLSCKVLCGIVSVGDQLKFYPAGLVTKIKTIEIEHVGYSSASAGKRIGITLADKDIGDRLTKNFSRKTGLIGGPVDDETFKPTQFAMSTFINLKKELPGLPAKKFDINVGSSATCFHGCGETNFKIVAILKELKEEYDESSFLASLSNRRKMNKGKVLSKFTDLIIIALKKDNLILAKYVLIDQNKAIGCGIFEVAYTLEQVLEMFVKHNVPLQKTKLYVNGGFAPKGTKKIKG